MIEYGWLQKGVIYSNIWVRNGTWTGEEYWKGSGRMTFEELVVLEEGYWNKVINDAKRDGVELIWREL